MRVLVREQGATLFARYLDLSALRGRRRGLVPCLFHAEHTPSLSVDLDAGVFHCFGCGEQGGVLRFAELVGEALEPIPRAPAPPPTEWEQAWRRAVRTAEAQGRQHAEWAPHYAVSDFIRRSTVAVLQARAVATRLGPTHPKTWPLLELAAHAERDEMRVTAAMDALLEEGRIYGISAPPRSPTSSRPSQPVPQRGRTIMVTVR
jgi:hypothetical protein